jgi:hypothetical protein
VGDLPKQEVSPVSRRLKLPVQLIVRMSVAGMPGVGGYPQGLIIGLTKCALQSLTAQNNQRVHN